MTNNYSPEAGLPKPSPNFNNLLKVLRCEAPDRPTLFEFFMNGPLYRRLSAHLQLPPVPEDQGWLLQLQAFLAAGYDYATFSVPNFAFPAAELHREQTISLNDGAVIADRDSFARYAWPDPAAADYHAIDQAGRHLPNGMKLVVCGPCGVLENVIRLVGYENLCFMVLDNEQLAYDIFEAVGSRLVDYYRRAAASNHVGACIANDDWGFKSQTMLAPDDMRRFVFPWHREIVKAVHAAGKPVILHSCGYYNEIIEDVIEDMKFDGRHSYEDGITPVEQAYTEYDRRLAILGGIDVDFICRHSPTEVYARSKAMLERTAPGGFALGTGNSVPEYVPVEGYMAMIRAALDLR